jgi:predicted membrane protein
LILGIPIALLFMLFGKQTFQKASENAEVVLGVLFAVAVVAAVIAAIRYS